MYESDDNVPQWFINGMKAVQKTPSAINKQSVKFNYKKENVTAKVLGDSDGELVDLSIAKLHFEVGSGEGHWEFGNGAAFIIYKNRR
ncbi:nitroreductase family protein [Clostridium sp.]|uniref:nitroreductase family protein n=1 Tax=Clostridium sp. TaxID=1506 RepID=UPI0032169DD8